MVSSLSSDQTLVRDFVPTRTMPLGQILLRKRWLTSQALSEALALQSSFRVPLGEILLRSGCITSHQLDKALQEQRWRAQGLWIIN